MNIVATTVFCDEVRTEHNGKHILIGTYGSDLVPGAMPSAFPIALWIRIEGLASGKADFRLDLEMPDRKNSVTVDGKGDLLDVSRPIIMVFNNLPCQIEQYGEMRCRLTINDGEPMDIGKLAVSPPPKQ